MTKSAAVVKLWNGIIWNPCSIVRISEWGSLDTELIVSSAFTIKVQLCSCPWGLPPECWLWPFHMPSRIKDTCMAPHTITHTHTHTHTHIHTHARTFIIDTHAHARTCTHAHTHILHTHSTHTDNRHTRTCAHAHAHTCTHTHTHILHTHSTHT